MELLKLALVLTFYFVTKIYQFQDLTQNFKLQVSVYFYYLKNYLLISVQTNQLRFLSIESLMILVISHPSALQ